MVQAHMMTLQERGYLLSDLKPLQLICAARLPGPGSTGQILGCPRHRSHPAADIKEWK